MSVAGDPVDFDHGNGGILQRWSWGEGNDHFAWAGDTNPYYAYYSGINFEAWFTGQYHLFGAPTWECTFQYWNGSRWSNAITIVFSNNTYDMNFCMGKISVCRGETGTTEAQTILSSGYHAFRLEYRWQGSGLLPEDANGGMESCGWKGSANTSQNPESSLETRYNSWLRNKIIYCTDVTKDTIHCGRGEVGCRDDLTPYDEAIYDKLYNTATMSGSPIYASRLQNHFCRIRM